MKAKLDKLKEQRDNYWELIKTEEYFLYPTDPEQDMENYKSLCKQIEEYEAKQGS